MPDSSGFIGVGIASDLHERGLPEFLNAGFADGRIDYYEFYLYRENGLERANEVRRRIDPAIPLVWHCGGEFELPLASRPFEAHAPYIRDVVASWRPLWCLEDVCAITLGGTRPTPSPLIGHVPPPLTAAVADRVVQNLIAAKRVCPLRSSRRFPTSTCRYRTTCRSRRSCAGSATARIPTSSSTWATT